MEKESFINDVIPKIKVASFTDLTEQEINQTANYIWIFKSHKFKEHWEVNNLISKENRWDEFDSLRSLNNHGVSGIIRGIAPKFFGIICKVLNVGGDDGEPLIDYEKY